MRYIYFWFLFFCCAIANAQTLKNCSSCANKLINQAEIASLSADEIRLLTNEIYARKGYRFDNQRFQDFFDGQSWYKPVNDNKSIVYNSIEKENISLLQNRVKQLKLERTMLINQLKVFKKLALSNSSSELKSQFGFTYEPDNQEEPKLLKEVLSKINLDDINDYKEKGLHSTLVDNGFVKKLFELSIEKANINVIYDYMAHSKIIEDFGEFTDYRSENEFMYNWQFEYKNGKLKFVRLAVAG